MKESTKVLRLVESALLLALATALSMIKVLDLPAGGSVTACSALPVLLIGYRHGVGYGLFAGTAHALIQLLLGLNTLSYCTTPMAAVAVIVLDYLLAFAVLGLGGLFRRGRSQGQALVLAALVTGALRYVFHVIAGCTVWAGLSIPDSAALLYSLAYNATYMVPEVIVTVLGVWYFSRAVDIQGTRPARVAVAGGGKRSLWSLLAAGCAVAAVFTDVLLVFRHLQNADSGEFDITGIVNVDWMTVIIVTGVGAVLTVALEYIARRRKQA